MENNNSGSSFAALLVRRDNSNPLVQAGIIEDGTSVTEGTSSREHLTTKKLNKSSSQIEKEAGTGVTNSIQDRNRQKVVSESS